MNETIQQVAGEFPLLYIDVVSAAVDKYRILIHNKAEGFYTGLGRQAAPSSKGETNMNYQRRKRLRVACSLLEEASSIVEDVRDEEQDSLDNMPENLQDSERAERM